VIWFQTDLGYEATRERLRQFKDLIIGDMEGWKGITTFYFKNMKDFCAQITTNGKLGIFYPESVGYRVFLERLKPYLFRPDGTQATEFTVIYNTESREVPEHLFTFKFTPKSYELALQHSKLIILGDKTRMGISSYPIKSLVNIFVMDPKMVMDFFNHLRTGYPQIYEKFEECLRILKERGRLIKRITGRRGNILKVSYTFGALGRGIEINDADIHKLNLIEKRFEKSIKELANELETIYKEVESGIPLKGYCDFCPHRKLVIKEK